MSCAIVNRARRSRREAEIERVCPAGQVQHVGDGEPERHEPAAEVKVVCHGPENVRRRYQHLSNLTACHFKSLDALRAILTSQIGAPALVERNQLVRMTYAQGTLSIVTEGRALDRAGAGELVRVMNLASRKTVTGTVAEDGSIEVGP